MIYSPDCNETMPFSSGIISSRSKSPSTVPTYLWFHQGWVVSHQLGTRQCSLDDRALEDTSLAFFHDGCNPISNVDVFSSDGIIACYSTDATYLRLHHRKTGLIAFSSRPTLKILENDRLNETVFWSVTLSRLH